MSTAVEILEFSRDLVKSGWTRGIWAEDRDEQEVDLENPRACSFCALGAFLRASRVLKPHYTQVARAQNALSDSLPGDFTITEFNDSQYSEEPIIDLFDRAIESLKAADA